jgi:hypothetical protein
MGGKRLNHLEDFVTVTGPTDGVPAAHGIQDGQTGTVTVIQRFGYRRSYCDLLHEQSLDGPPCGSGASKRSRQALEPRSGVLGDLQPPDAAVRLEIVALAVLTSPRLIQARTTSRVTPKRLAAPATE